MKNFIKTLFLICIILLSQNSLAKNIKINKVFTKDTTLYIFNKTKTVSSVKINAKFDLLSKFGLVRVLLVDKDDNEYLICEAYDMIVKSRSFTLNMASEETKFLENIKPKSIKIQLLDAKVEIKSFEILEDKMFVDKSYKKRKENSKHNDLTQKINLINKYIEENNLKWRAGETELSKMTYQQKKQYFCGASPELEKFNSFGLEYYIGGVFEIFDYNTVSENTSVQLRSANVINDSPYIDEFDWRNKHNATVSTSPYYNGEPINGWITPVKKQWLGTCWAFSPVAATEAYVNLYYNRHIDLDLSEHDVITCSGGWASESGGYVFIAMNYLKYTGVVDENCFPNPIDNIKLPCTSKCTTPLEKIKFGNYTSEGLLNEEKLKGIIINNPPTTFAITSPYIGHATVLVGYKVLKLGDILYQESSNSYQIVVDETLAGRTCWIVKNSGGTNDSRSPYGYTYYLIDNYNYVSNIYKINGAVSSLQYTVNDIRCVDLDGDGYYNWGVGPKPANCPPCTPNEPDGNDADPTLGPMNEYGYCALISDIEYYNPEFITDVQNWNIAKTLCGDLVIESGGILTITAGVTVPEKRSIYIQNGGKLIVLGGTIVNGNIIARNGSNLIINNNGIVRLNTNDNLIIQTGATYEMILGEIQINH